MDTTQADAAIVRPSAITVLCIILLMIGASQMVHAFIAFGIHAGPNSLYGVLFSGLALLSYYGLWNMRKWAVFLFAVVWSVNLLVLFLLSSETSILAHIRFWISPILMTAYFAVVLPHWKQFNSARPVRAEED